MASSYSSNLKIELIGSGEQAGTWGTTTNKNWEKSEESSASFAQVTITQPTDSSGSNPGWHNGNATYNWTLSDTVDAYTANSASDVGSSGRAAFVEFIGSPGKNVTVNIRGNSSTEYPKRVMFVKNSVGNTLTFNCNSGTNFVLTNGSVAAIYTDPGSTVGNVFDTMQIGSGTAGLVLSDASIKSLNGTVNFDDDAITTTGNISTTSSGTITSAGLLTASAGISANDQNITNVGDINCDSVSVDDATQGLNVDFSGGNTGTNKISLAGSLASALDITQSTNSYIKFVTNTPQIVFGQNSTFAGTTIANLGTVSAATSITSTDFVGDLTGTADTATDAVNVGVTATSTDASYFVGFLAASSGNQPVRADAGLKYNPDSNFLTVTGGYTTTGALDLVLNTNNGSSSGEIRITDAANGNISLTPNGTGEIVIGSGSASGKITTSGANDLVLDTNAGSSSGSITITDAADGDITLAPNGSGSNVFTGNFTLNGSTTSSKLGVSVTNPCILIGPNAGDSISSGSGNIVAIGKDAATDVSSGNNSVAISMGALKAATTAHSNIGIGINSLSGASSTAFTGFENVGIGVYAGKVLEGASNRNVFIGGWSGQNVTTGDFNTCVGAFSGQHISTGGNNTCIGRSASVSSGSASHRIVISSDDVQWTTDDSVFIGKSISSGLSSNYGNGTWSVESDLRIKKELDPVTIGLDFINDLNPVSFKMREASDVSAEDDPEIADRLLKADFAPDSKRYGFIAQEVKSAMDNHNASDFPAYSSSSDGVGRVGAGDFVIPLVKAVQELSGTVDALNARIAELEGDA